MTDYLKPLDRAALEAMGIEGFAFGYADRVRFGELDALNHVNNVVYLRWFETIRVEYIRAYGVSAFGAPGDPQMVVRRVSADYFAPVLENQTYVVTARTSQVKESSFVMTYGVFVDGRQMTEGEAVCVSLAPDGSARQPLRAAAVEAMVARDDAKRG